MGSRGAVRGGWGPPCGNVVGPSLETGGILHPGLGGLRLPWVLLPGHRPFLAGFGLLELLSCALAPLGAPAASRIFQRSTEPFAPLQSLRAAGSISPNRAGVSSEGFQLVRMIKLPHIKSKVDFTFA